MQSFHGALSEPPPVVGNLAWFPNATRTGCTMLEESHPMRQIVLGISAIIVLLLAGCSTSAVQTASRKQLAAAVTTAVAAEKAVPLDVRVVGTVETQAAVRVKSQVAGQLLKVYFREGQDVKSGDPLFQIDPRTYDEAIRQAEANMARNVALLRQAEANLKRDTAQEKYARDQASRYQQLFTAGVMSREQAEQYASEADARGEAVRASQAAIESAHAAIRSDEAALASAKLQRSFCDISSPVDGRTGDLVVEVGNLVRASDAEMVTINRIHPIYVTFSVPENRLPEV
ncbi:MAG: efflux RND transporter periplasmic adaptor subunit, partial [Acidobacteria bacterium]